MEFTIVESRRKAKLLSVITKRYVEVEKRPQIKKSPFPVLDFEKDGDYIYASFMQAYKIDLIEEQGRLPWKNFCIYSTDYRRIQKLNRSCGLDRCRFQNTTERIQKKYRK